MKTKVKIFGERNTGTNYLEKLIALNFKDIELIKGVAPASLRFVAKYLSNSFGESLIDTYFKINKKSFGWKHTSLETWDETIYDSLIEDKVFIICMVKNPYSYLLSLYKRPYHLKVKANNFAQFLDEDFDLRHREGLSSQSRVNPISLWNAKVKSYLKARDRTSLMIIKYEDLLENYISVLKEISKYLNLELRSDYRNYEKPAKKDNTKDFEYFRSYYIDEIWRSKLNSREIEKINGVLDMDLLDAFGYKCLDGN